MVIVFMSALPFADFIFVINFTSQFSKGNVLNTHYPDQMSSYTDNDTNHDLRSMI